MTWPDDDCRRCQRRESNLGAELARREAEIAAAWEALPDDVAGDYSTLADAIRRWSMGWMAGNMAAKSRLKGALVDTYLAQQREVRG